MKNVILVGLVAFGLVACGAKEEAVVVEETPTAEAAAPAEAPAADVAVVEAPAEAAPAAEAVDAAPVVQ
jgi:uncharacterized protein YcfL